VDAADIRAFVQRDWQLLREYKERAWEPVKGARGATAAVLAAESLRLAARELTPEWPSEVDRRVDLESHARVSRALRSVPWP
jgi:hypothetical protein